MKPYPFRKSHPNSQQLKCLSLVRKIAATINNRLSRPRRRDTVAGHASCHSYKNILRNYYKINGSLWKLASMRGTGQRAKGTASNAITAGISEERETERKIGVT